LHAQSIRIWTAIYFVGALHLRLIYVSARGLGGTTLSWYESPLGANREGVIASARTILLEPVAMTKAFVRPRPIRIAFLVDEHEHWREMLQGILANSYGRWGGRFSLIVPCENGKIRPAYLPWLEAYDPDLIYSYVDLSDATVERLHERLYPSSLVRHNFFRAERDVYAFRPEFSLGPLSSLSVTLVASRGGMLSGPRPVTLVDSYGRAAAPQFLQENFGCYRDSLNPWPVPGNWSEYVRTFALVGQEVIDDPCIVPRPQGEYVTDYKAMLDRLSTQRDLVGLAQLSAWMCPRLQMNDPRWTNRVNLFVGDSFVDRVTFWNARSHLDVYLDGGLVTLKMSKADIDDEETFAAIIKIIRNRIHVSHSQNNSEIAIRSASHTAEELEGMVARFRAADRWNRYSSQPIDSIDQCCPGLGVLETAMRHVEDRGVFQSSDWHETTFSDETFRPPLIAPRHIRGAPTSPFGGNRGTWALDVDIKRTNDYSRFHNVQHHWRLPRSLRMTSAFTRLYQLGGTTGPLCAPRVSSEGLITLYGAQDAQLPELRVPTDEVAFRYALRSPRDWQPFAPGRGPLQNSLVLEIRPSDKGRYLTALTRLSGGIHRSREIFLNKFWKEQFEFLGASPSAGEDRLPELVRRLQNRLRSGAIQGQEDWERIGRVVLGEAREVRVPPQYLRFDHLAARFEDFRNDYWSNHTAGTPREQWDDEEKRSLARSVQYLCQREILHQGREWLCPRCNNSNWVSIDAIRKSMVCEVCGTAKPAPVAGPWHFRLNTFVLDGLRAHGMLAHVWCLSRLSDLSHACFSFLEPHELFFTTESAYAGRPDAEIDLMVVTDGTVRLCEVKTSNQNISIEKLADLARRIRPDIATLAIMEPRSGGTDRRLEQLRQALEGSGIKAEVITLDGNDIDDSPNLPTGTSQLIRLF
jgi:hypothetical protein